MCQIYVLILCCSSCSQERVHSRDLRKSQMLRMANLKVIARKALLVHGVMILANFVVYVRRYRQNLPICDAEVKLSLFCI